MIDLGNNTEGKRKLATIQLISDLKEIKGADKIELAVVEGWSCVVKKGEFQVGDKCVYVEIDSLLPERPEYEFLRASSFKESNEYNPSGFKLNTVKLRGQISQGLALPLGVYSEDIKNELESKKVGDDVSELLGIVKYVYPEVDGGFGKVKGGYIRNSSKTDELRIQSNLDFLEYLKGKPYYITVKDDGTSTSIEQQDTKVESFGVYSRNSKYVLDETDGITKFIDRLDFKEDLRNLVELEGAGFVLKGELVGPKVQHNKLGLKELDIKFFTLERLDERGKLVRQSWDELVRICTKLGLKTVDLVEKGDSFNYSLEELLELAKGKYSGTDNHREGIVIRPYFDNDDETISDDYREFSFKVINNDFLLKQK